MKVKPKTVKANCPHGEMLDVAFDVARRLIDFESYGCSKHKACKALARRCRGFEPQEYENALIKAILLYEVAHDLVEKHRENLWQTYNKPEDLDLANLVAEARKLCPGFQIPTYKSAIWWLFFWHHLK